MAPLKIHHIGIVVPSPEKLKRFMTLLKLEEDYSGYVNEYNARCVFMKDAGVQLEFIIPAGGILKNYNQGLSGLHHIAFETDDIRRLQSEFETQGIKFLEEEPIKGAGNFLINFLSPVYLGVTIEFVEVLDADRSDGKKRDS